MNIVCDVDVEGGSPLYADWLLINIKTQKKKVFNALMTTVYSEALDEEEFEMSLLLFI